MEYSYSIISCVAFMQDINFNGFNCTIQTSCKYTLTLMHQMTYLLTLKIIPETYSFLGMRKISNDILFSQVYINFIGYQQMLTKSELLNILWIPHCWKWPWPASLAWTWPASGSSRRSWSHSTTAGDFAPTSARFCCKFSWDGILSAPMDSPADHYRYHNCCQYHHHYQHHYLRIHIRTVGGPVKQLDVVAMQESHARPALVSQRIVLEVVVTLLLLLLLHRKA